MKLDGITYMQFVCPSLAICTALTPHKTITVLYRLAFWVLLSPDDWRQRIGRPRQSWLRTVEADLRPMNLGLATWKRRAQNRSAGRKPIDNVDVYDKLLKKKKFIDEFTRIVSNYLT